MLIRSWNNREIQVDNGSCNAENDSQIYLQGGNAVLTLSAIVTSLFSYLTLRI